MTFAGLHLALAPEWERQKFRIVEERALTMANFIVRKESNPGIIQATRGYMYQNFCNLYPVLNPRVGQVKSPGISIPQEGEMCLRTTLLPRHPKTGRSSP